MNHPHVHKKGTAANVAASVSSVVFSIIASSHHWLHMGILLILGGSTNMMAAFTGVLWLRRVMVTATLITSVYSIYRLRAHKQMPVWMKIMNAASVVISMGFIFYTLMKFGW